MYSGTGERKKKKKENINNKTETWTPFLPLLHAQLSPISILPSSLFELVFTAGYHQSIPYLWGRNEQHRRRLCLTVSLCCSSVLLARFPIPQCGSPTDCTPSPGVHCPWATVPQGCPVPAWVSHGHSLLGLSPSRSVSSKCSPARCVQYRCTARLTKVEFTRLATYVQATAASSMPGFWP